MINDFRYRNFFLSNYYPEDIVYEGITYKSSEAAFQAAKILGKNTAETAEKRKKFIGVMPNMAKKMGRKVELRPDWDLIKDDIMLDILRIKFKTGSKLAKKLIETGEQELIENNTWHDNYWGSCTCDRCRDTGLNKLGKLLMQVRLELITK